MLRRVTLATKSIFAIAMALVLVGCNADGDSGDGQGELADAATESGTESEIAPRTLVYASGVPQDHITGVSFLDWAERVTELTGGAIEFEMHWGGSLCSLPEGAACLKDGRAHIALTGSGLYDPGAFPAAFIGSVPFLAYDLQAQADALLDMYRTNDEFSGDFHTENQHFLYPNPIDLPALATNTRISHIDDLRGMNIRIVGGGGPAFEALGVNPIAMDPAEQYESLQRGVIAGTMNPIDSMPAYGLPEVTDYYYNLGDYAGTYAYLNHGISLDLWEELEEEVREAMTTASEEITATYVESYTQGLAPHFCAETIKHDIIFETLQPTEAWEAWADEWREEILDSYKSRAAQDGTTDPDAVVEHYQTLLAEHANQETFSTFALCAEIADAG